MTSARRTKATRAEQPEPDDFTKIDRAKETKDFLEAQYLKLFEHVLGAWLQLSVVGNVKPARPPQDREKAKEEYASIRRRLEKIGKMLDVAPDTSVREREWIDAQTARFEKEFVQWTLRAEDVDLFFDPSLPPDQQITIPLCEKLLEELRAAREALAQRLSKLDAVKIPDLDETDPTPPNGDKPVLAAVE